MNESLRDLECSHLFKKTGNRWPREKLPFLGFSAILYLASFQWTFCFQFFPRPFSDLQKHLRQSTVFASSKRKGRTMKLAWMSLYFSFRSNFGDMKPAQWSDSDYNATICSAKVRSWWGCRRIWRFLSWRQYSYNVQWLGYVQIHCVSDQYLTTADDARRLSCPFIFARAVIRMLVRSECFSRKCSLLTCFCFIRSGSKGLFDYKLTHSKPSKFKIKITKICLNCCSSNGTKVMAWSRLCLKNLLLKREV